MRRRRPRGPDRQQFRPERAPRQQQSAAVRAGRDAKQVPDGHGSDGQLRRGQRRHVAVPAVHQGPGRRRGRRQELAVQQQGVLRFLPEGVGGDQLADVLRVQAGRRHDETGHRAGRRGLLVRVRRGGRRQRQRFSVGAAGR